jgi:hypothetical protein
VRCYIKAKNAFYSHNLSAALLLCCSDFFFARQLNLQGHIFSVNSLSFPVVVQCVAAVADGGCAAMQKWEKNEQRQQAIAPADGMFNHEQKRKTRWHLTQPLLQPAHRHILLTNYNMMNTNCCDIRFISRPLPGCIMSRLSATQLLPHLIRQRSEFFFIRLHLLLQRESKSSSAVQRSAARQQRVASPCTPAP